MKYPVLSWPKPTLSRTSWCMTALCRNLPPVEERQDGRSRNNYIALSSIIANWEAYVYPVSSNQINIL